MNVMRGLRGRLILLGFVPVFLFLLLSFAYIVPSTKKDIFNEKELQTKEFVNIGMSTIELYYSMEQSGELTREEAQESAKAVIKNIRFGETMEDYFWINDTHPRMIMHPFRPDLDGADLSELQDPDGLHLFNEFVKVTDEAGSGFVPYQWQYYSDSERIEPKLSYVAKFEPWDWIIGTGIYTNDVAEIVNRKMVTTVGYILVIIVITSTVIVIFSYKLVIHPLNDAVRIGEKMAAGDFTEDIDQKYIGKKDEISRLLTIFGRINKNMADMIGDVLNSSNNIDHQASQLKIQAEDTNDSIENTVDASKNLLDAAASQKVGASESYTAIEEMAIGVNNIAETSSSINHFSVNLIDKVSAGNEIVTEAINKMLEIKGVTESTSDVIKQLNEDTNEIGSILALINDVADQTNLLALNAAIEAARVGEQGKGFAVVADEIRKLATSTADSVGKVAKIIDAVAGKTDEAVNKTRMSVNSVEQGIDNVKKVEILFFDILKSQEEISKQISEMSAITVEMSAGAEEITATVSEFSNTAELTANNAQTILDVSTQQLENMNKVLAFAQELDSMSNTLKTLVNQFKV
ncbi:methyl-accepting chemotaxis protein [Evansella caseinilytica]|uniref:Methyl-accepting chemotaxis protein n=1 Tax=Evansella caseinilytica TaxID=1503961 RepID=A0A1H3HXI3_9BACI|nr:methyl-accepting chemotaxis protein [Evansella caseinilytica]SDY19558.1 methyl-accepting chemotaxis protein [Evansella caseinilytica]